MPFLKGKKPGETYHQLVAIKDPSTGDYVLSRDDQLGNAEAIPVWVKVSSNEAVKIQATDGTEVFVVDTTSNLVTLNKLNITGSITSSTNAATKQYVDSERGILYAKVTLSDATVVSEGWKFTLPNNITPLNGSVQVIINGVYYLSNSNQMDISVNSDFHIEGTDVIIHNLSNGGTISLLDEDDIGIYYQKEVT